MMDNYFWYLDYIPSGSFAAGFIAGQLAFTVFLLIIIRFLFLKSPYEPISIQSLKPRKEAAGMKTDRLRIETESSQQILSRLGADQSRMGSETCTWLNFLLARIVFSRLHEEPKFMQDVIEQIESLVSNASEYLTGFSVKRLELSKQTLPRLTELQVKRFYGGLPKALDEVLSDYCIEGRLVWPDAASLEVEACATVNWPSNHPFVMLPCQLSVHVRSIDARFRLTFPEESFSLTPRPYMSRLDISLIPDEFRIDLDIGSSIGHRAKLNNVQKIGQMLGTLIREGLQENVVWPNRVSVEVPTPADLIFPLA